MEMASKLLSPALHETTAGALIQYPPLLLVPTETSSSSLPLHTTVYTIYSKKMSLKCHLKKKSPPYTAQCPRYERGLPLSGHFSLTPFIVSCCCSQILSSPTLQPVGADWEQLQPMQLEHFRGWSAGASVVLADRVLSIHVSCNEIFEGDKTYYTWSYTVVHNLGLATDSSTAAKYVQCQLSRQREDSQCKRECPRR